MPQPTSTRRNLHAEITDQLLGAIESGPGSFMLPWHSDAGSPLHLPVNAATGRSYTGINILSLWIAATRSNLTQPVWAIYRQWAERGGQVRKGERAATVIFYKEFITDAEPTDTESKGQRRVARATAVFSAEQVTGFTPPPPIPRLANGEFEHLSAVDNFIADTNAIIRQSGDRAYYDRSADLIQMPSVKRFMGTSTSTVAEAFYSTVLHELVHWSGAAHRLDRTFGERFGDQAYAAEELVAKSAPHS
nr:ArdC-like ssDNA-binding domain-containing protein [Devosia submarina]